MGVRLAQWGRVGMDDLNKYALIIVSVIMITITSVGRGL